MEHVRGEQRENSSLLPEHAADERIDADQEAELGEVRPQSERDRSLARCGCGHPPSIRRLTSRQALKPPSRTARLPRPWASGSGAAVRLRTPLLLITFS